MKSLSFNKTYSELYGTLFVLFLHLVLHINILTFLPQKMLF